MDTSFLVCKFIASYALSCREALLISELAQIVSDFEGYLMTQKKTSDEMSKFTDSNFREVSEKVSTQLQVESELCN